MSDLKKYLKLSEVLAKGLSDYTTPEIAEMINEEVKKKDSKKLVKLRKEFELRKAYPIPTEFKKDKKSKQSWEGTHYTGLAKVLAESPELEEHARTMVGDGKLPNKYFVSVASVFYVEDEDGNIQWAEEYLKGLMDPRNIVVGEFDTYREAKNYADEIPLGSKMEGFIVNLVTIEDRISGEVYERTKILSPRAGDFHPWETEDIKFTKEKIEEQGQEFA